MTTSDADFGCSAFGHLASPFVDGELAREERESFATHLDTCRPCQKIIASFRAIDVLARQAPPAVAPADWDRAWSGIASAIEADREAAAAAPLASVAAFSSRLGQGRRAWLRPLGYAAAATILVALTLSLQRGWDRPTEIDRTGVTRHSTIAGATGASVASGATGILQAVASAPSRLMAISCRAPDFVPVVYTIDGEEPMTVVQCAMVGPLPGMSGSAGPTEG